MGMTISLIVTKRDAAEKAQTTRTAGKVPAVVYGPKQNPLTIAVEAKGFDTFLKSAGESTVISLTGLGKSIDVLIKGVEFDPVKQQIQHVDFYAVEQGKEITTHVPLVFIGEAPVEKSGLGSVTKVHQDVEVTCEPSKLPQHFDIDLSSLVTVEDKILISDIKLPAGVTIEADPHDAIVVVSVAEAEETAETATEATPEAAA